MARNKNSNNRSERNNYQDKSEVREYDKGYNAGKQRSRNNSNPKNKGRGRNSGGRGVASIETGAKDNDYNWYVPNGQILTDVASIQEVVRGGAPLTLNYQDNAFSPMATIVPGIMTYYYVPTVGNSQDGDSALNVAATSLYTRLRLKTNVASNYDKNDAMLYIISVGQLYAYYAYVTKVYGCAQYWDQYSTYLPKGIVNSMGVDYDNIIANMADFRAWINQFAYALQSLPVPNVLPYTTRQIFMNESVYTDSPNSKKHQYSHFCPMGFYKYSEGTSESAAGKLTLRYLPYFLSGAAELIPPQRDRMRWDELKLYGDELLKPILGSQDMAQYIAGDILKAYSGSSLYIVSPIAETFVVRPGYNAEVLEQMENMYIYPAEYVSSEVVQSVAVNNTYLISDLKMWYEWKPTAQQAEANYQRWQIIKESNERSLVLNRHEDGFPPERVMTMTRLSGVLPMLIKSDNKITGPDNVKHNGYFVPYTCGTEVVICAIMSYYASKTSPGTMKTSEHMFRTDNWMDLNAAATDFGFQMFHRNLALMDAVASFDWHPKLRTVIHETVTEEGNTNTFYEVTGGNWDLDNYTQISVEVLRNLNDVAVLGEFASKLNLYDNGK